MQRGLELSIQSQRRDLERTLIGPMAELARDIAPVWGDRQAMDEVLVAHIDRIPFSTFLYAVDPVGFQVSDNVARTGLLPEHYGRDRSQRPYMLEAGPDTVFLLSQAYISLLGRRPSLTALQVAQRDGERLGYVCTDFDLRNLPITAPLYDEPLQWRQIKGDAAIRGSLFAQQRVDSLLDGNIDQAMSILEELATAHGMFQCVLHFSSSRATVWVVEDPFRYRILTHEALSDPDVCFAYSRTDYPADALIPAVAIAPILANMKTLRFSDEYIYLRSASINIFNGMVSLTFSCDGSHYMAWDEFLDKSAGFWLGSAV